MTNSTRWIGLIMMAAILVGSASAQESFEWDDAAPPSLSLPAENGGTAPGGSRADEHGQSMLIAPAPEDGLPFDGYHPEAYSEFTPGLHDHFHGPTAPIESTGTWLRRGFWYAEAEAVVWNRMWNRDDKFFAVADSVVEDNALFLGGAAAVTASLDTNRLLMLQSTNPGQDASVRATLGQFLFRDSRNRDHTAEFTALGGGDWHQQRVISSPENFGLFVPFHMDGGFFDENPVSPTFRDRIGNRSFDRSTRQFIAYSSHYSSIEGNYRVRSRMQRDRLIMDANGHWHRAASNTWVREYLAGLRFIELRDILDWRAEDIQDINNDTSTEPGNDGNYYIWTDNDLFGVQLGTGLTYEAPRWSLGVTCKGGIFINDALGRSSLNFTSDDEDDFDLRLREDELSFVGEAKVMGRFHVTPNVSLRASYEAMMLESVALAPSQANFIPHFGYLNTTGDPFYHGASFGFETFW
jgi:hypothetical protein